VAQPYSSKKDVILAIVVAFLNASDGDVQMIGVDIAEPEELTRLLATAVELQRVNLNKTGYGDYVFTTSDGVLIQIEREPASAIVSDAVSIEQEIMRHYQKDSYTILIQEGVVLPVSEGCEIYTFKTGHFHLSRFLLKPYAQYIAWRHQIEEAGIEYMDSPSLEATAIIISAIYRNSQKLEHSTLRRYRKPLTGWRPNPYITSLMGLEGAGLGEKKASMLIDKFKTPWGVFTASMEDICTIQGFGRETVKNIWASIGKGYEADGAVKEINNE